MNEKINLPQPNTYQYVIEKSKFIAYSFYFDDKSKLQEILKEIKREHLSARHAVYAYRYFEENINDFVQKPAEKIVQSYFDDGEPSGTGGAPVLRTIEENNLFNILIVVVRYFGGIKLGIPGLTKAYKQAAQGVLEPKELSIKNIYKITTDYTMLNTALNFCEKNGSIESKNFEEKAEIIFGTEEGEDIFRFVTAADNIMYTQKRKKKLSHYLKNK